MENMDKHIYDAIAVIKIEIFRPEILKNYNSNHSLSGHLQRKYDLIWNAKSLTREHFLEMALAAIGGAFWLRNKVFRDKIPLEQIVEIIEIDVRTELRNNIVDHGLFDDKEEFAFVLKEELEEFWDSVKANSPSIRELYQVAAVSMAGLIWHEKAMLFFQQRANGGIG